MGLCKQRDSTRAKIGLAAMVWLSVCLLSSTAAVNSWTGGGANNNWTTSNNWSLLRVPTNIDDVVFDSGGGKASTINGAFTIASLTVTNGYTNTVTQNADLTVINDFMMYTGVWQFTAGTAAGLTVSNNMVLTNATIYCQYSSIAGNGTGRTFVVVGNLTVAPDASFNAVARGFAASAGPGKPIGSGGGGGHGGMGGNWNNSASGGGGGLCYGSVTNPTSLGSGGGNSAGGGAIVLIVSGAATIDGLLDADGGVTSADRGTGAGGTINLRANAVGGSGIVRARGGRSTYTVSATSPFSTGGGGRIAIYTPVLSLPITNISVSSLWSGTYGKAGAAGTIYIQTDADPLGTLTIDASNVVTSAGAWPYPTTLITNTVTDISDGNVLITNRGVLEVVGDVPLTVNGYWTNAGSFFVRSGHTVTLAGTNTASMSGSNAFFNLTCTNGGKIVYFDEKKTNIVQGLLTLKGESGNLLTLRSSGADYWFLRVVNAALTHEVRYVDAQRSYATAASIDTYDSVNSGSNVNWTFSLPGQTNVWTGGVNTNWGHAGNWSLGRTTVQQDEVIVSNPATFFPTLDYAKVVKRLTVQPGASMRLGGYNLTITSNVTVNGTLTANGSETITLSGDVDFSGGTFVASNSTVVLNGEAAQAITSDGEKFRTVSIVNTAGVVTFTDAAAATNIGVAQATVAFAGGLAAGALTNQSGSLTFVGPVDVGTLVSHSGPLAFSNVVALGSLAHHDASVQFGDGVTVGDVRVWGQAALTFDAGSLVEASNLWISGNSATSITLRSSSDGNSWRLKVGQASGVFFADVKDSDASEGLELKPIRCADSTGNVHWDFSQSADWRDWVGSVSTVFTNAANWSPAEVPGSTSLLLLDGFYTNAARLTSPLTVSNLVVGGHQAITLTVDSTLTVAEDLVIAPNGVLNHTANSASPVYSLNVTVGRDLIVRGSINVAGKGYAAGQGPGQGMNSQGGGGHGGEGGTWANDPVSSAGKCYGSVTSPATLGSGGRSGPGGGIIRLMVDGRTLVDGIIAANGLDIGSTAAGAGGSVWLTTGTLDGTGTICADGGRGGSWSTWGYSHGGGGRVAVYLGSGDEGGVQLRAASLTGANATHTGGGAGTVYLRRVGEADGICFIDNNNVINARRTVITSNVTDAVVGDVVLRNNAQFTVETNQVFTVNGSWSNGITWTGFVATSNSTVRFGGTNVAMVLNHNRFYNLTVDEAGKAMRFEAGKTNYVTGALTLMDAELRSTADDSPWYLVHANGASQNVVRVAVRDSDASAGQTITAYPASADIDNNINWLFPGFVGSVFVIH